MSGHDVKKDGAPRRAAVRDGSMGGTLWAQVARDLRAGIASGRYPIGSLLPTELELCEQYGMSRHTVRT
ncbi:GntR family transcriptional regulator, partial [Methylobacterium frigidaeris]|uniref:GntR family transcriptional regulator n=1 Tax=Methylobacterium frigidaeris TaxID=2038277 RepID=UPI0031456AE8